MWSHRQYKTHQLTNRLNLCTDMSADILDFNAGWRQMLVQVHRQLYLN